MQLDPDFLHQRGVQKIFNALSAYKTYIVGGAVRDCLLEKPVTDIDFATSAPPDAITKAAKTSGLGVLPLGIAHGTLTLTWDKKTYQVTSFRRDIKTDGRHAEVRFGATLKEDALRRDFTFNALYLDQKGQLYDPVGGVCDLRENRVRFIGEASARLKEDWLRALRYFRFFATFGLTKDACQPKIFRALKAAKPHITGLSRERIHKELITLLSTPNPHPALCLMCESGILSALLPGGEKMLAPIARLIKNERAYKLTPNPLNRLAILAKEAPKPLDNYCRPTRKEGRFLRTLAHLLDNAPSAPPLAQIAYKQGADIAVGYALLEATYAERPLEGSVLEKITHAAAQTFPLTASDFFPSFTGAALGELLKRGEELWGQSNFTLTRAELLQKLMPPEGNE